MQRKVNTSRSIREPADIPQVEFTDNSAAVHTLTVVQQPNNTCIITARVATPTGWQNKQLAFPGSLTVKQLAEHILNVENW